jgi:signal transduction histidine kinase
MHKQQTVIHRLQAGSLLLKWEKISRTFTYKSVKNNCVFQAWYSFCFADSKPMDTNEIKEQLAACMTERSVMANELQNEVNQTLASVLLWIQLARKENNILEDASLKQAEANLKDAIDRLRSLHYSLSTDLPS